MIDKENNLKLEDWIKCSEKLPEIFLHENEKEKRSDILLCYGIDNFEEPDKSNIFLGYLNNDGVFYTIDLLEGKCKEVYFWQQLPTFPESWITVIEKLPKLQLIEGKKRSEVVLCYGLKGLKDNEKENFFFAFCNEYGKFDLGNYIEPKSVKYWYELDWKKLTSDISKFKILNVFK